ncbi:unnamed protein product [Rhizoctonia solani]|uniref:F-box domain-containing protein n=1 Tax=Rhizoctonia solani TaxID=456999 RepID=A0A8H2WWE5_9AGAM|nr:unnamed protein product [Rhizoctonia solani]
MVGLLDLPLECKVHILSLAPEEIPRCKLVSRAFRDIINGSPMLRYLQELNSLGLMASRTVSNTLSLDQKLQTLRKRKRISSVYTCDPTIVSVDSEGYSGPHFGRDFVSCRGVLALKWQKKTEIHLLSSPNRNIGSNHYVLESLPRHWMMAIEPAFDLLVLFDSTDTDVSFYLRSLQTGLAYPDACLPTVVYEGEPDRSIRDGWRGVRIEITGHRIAYLRGYSHPAESISKVIIWDWTSGQTITSTDIAVSCFAFLSESRFIVVPPILHRRGSSEKKDLPLLVYTCDDVPLGDQARLSARLHMPPQSSAVSLRETKLSLSFQPPFWYSDLPVTTCSPPVIYDLPAKSQYLALRVLFGRSSVGIWVTLFTHVSRLFTLVNTLDPGPDQECVSIPWSDWASMVAWTGYRTDESRPQYGPAVFGHLVAHIKATPTASDPSSRDSQMVGSFFKDSYKNLKQDSLVRSFTISFETVPPGLDWYGMSFQDKLVEIMMDDEHVVILRRGLTADHSQPKIYVYSLW